MLVGYICGWYRDRDTEEGGEVRQGGDEEGGREREKREIERER